jgi:AbrB family looped-hinge helix DNA binding protein
VAAPVGPVVILCNNVPHYVACLLSASILSKDIVMDGKETGVTAATLTSKGQVTIPASIRKALRLTSGTQIDFTLSGVDGEATVRRLPTWEDLCGSVPCDGIHISIEGMDDAIGSAVEEELGSK